MELGSNIDLAVFEVVEYYRRLSVHNLQNAHGAKRTCLYLLCR